MISQKGGRCSTFLSQPHRQPLLFDAKYPLTSNNSPLYFHQLEAMSYQKQTKLIKLKDGKFLKLPGIVPKLSDTPGDTKWVGPALGEHTAEVLGALGYSGKQQRELKQRGFI
jgi:hypothetical protein